MFGGVVYGENEREGRGLPVSRDLKGYVSPKAERRFRLPVFFLFAKKKTFAEQDEKREQKDSGEWLVKMDESIFCFTQNARHRNANRVFPQFSISWTHRTQKEMDFVAWKKG
jgi:hypothetical protein